MSTQSQILGTTRPPFVDRKGAVSSCWYNGDQDGLRRAIVEWVNGRLPGSAEKRSLLLIKAGELLMEAMLPGRFIQPNGFFEEMEHEIDQLLAPKQTDSP